MLKFFYLFVGHDWHQYNFIVSTSQPLQGLIWILALS